MPYQRREVVSTKYRKANGVDNRRLMGSWVTEHLATTNSITEDLVTQHDWRSVTAAKTVESCDLQNMTVSLSDSLAKDASVGI